MAWGALKVSAKVTATVDCLVSSVEAIGCWWWLRGKEERRRIRQESQRLESARQVRSHKGAEPSAAPLWRGASAKKSVTSASKQRVLTETSQVKIKVVTELILLSLFAEREANSVFCRSALAICVTAYSNIFGSNSRVEDQLGSGGRCTSFFSSL